MSDNEPVKPMTPDDSAQGMQGANNAQGANSTQGVPSSQQPYGYPQNYGYFPQVNMQPMPQYSQYPQPSPLLPHSLVAHGVRPWNVLCIIGFVLAFIIPPVGLILSIIALVQINRTQEKSQAMSIAGIIVGAIMSFVLLAISVVFVMVLYYASEHPEEFEELLEENVPDDADHGMDQERVADHENIDISAALRHLEYGQRESMRVRMQRIVRS